MWWDASVKRLQTRQDELFSALPRIRIPEVTPTAVVTQGVDVGVTSGILMRGNAQNNIGVIIRLPNYVITPGFQLFFICGTTNVSVRFFWNWGERDR